MDFGLTNERTATEKASPWPLIQKRMSLGEARLGGASEQSGGRKLRKAGPAGNVEG